MGGRVQQRTLKFWRSTSDGPDGQRAQVAALLACCFTRVAAEAATRGTEQIGWFWLGGSDRFFGAPYENQGA